MSRRLLPFLAAVACSGGDGPGKEPGTAIIPPPATDPGDDSGLTPEETQPEGGTFIDAAAVLVVGRFAFDPASASHVEYAWPGEGLSPMELAVTFIDSAALTVPLDDRNSCTVTLEIPGPQPIADWVEANGAWTGFDVPPGAAVSDGCINYGLPGEFGGDPGFHVAKWDWAFGVGPLDPLVEEALQTYLPASEWNGLAPYIVGSATVSNIPVDGATEEGYFSAGYALANEVDGNFEVEVSGTGNPIPIPKELVDQKVGVTQGFYEVVLGQFSPAFVLTQEPQ